MLHVDASTPYASSVIATTGAELLAVAFAALAPDEQEQAFAGINDIRLTRLAAEEGETAGFLRSLRRVADLAGGELTPDVYRRVRAELVAAGEQVDEFSAVVRYFGSWAQAKEAVGLAELTTARKIDARFRSRLHGRQRMFREEELVATLARCVDDLGRIPLLAEYDEWRLRELALARTRGDEARIPSPSVFRRRYGSWEQALLACGYSPDAVYLRLEPQPERRSRLAKVDRYSEETLRETLLRCAADFGHVPLVDDFQQWRVRELKRTRSRALVLPSDSPYRRRWGTWERALRHLGFSAEEIAARHKPGRERSNESLRLFGYQ